MLPFDNKSEFQVVVDMPAGTPLEGTTAVLQDMTAWLAQHVAPLTLHDAQVDIGAPRSAIAELTVETARTFSNALIRAARTFTEGCGANGPAWIALNPQKGNIDRKPGWADDERLRRHAAMSPDGNLDP